MTYDWEPYKETCYRMYVEEKKTLRQVHAHLLEHHNFTPRYVRQKLTIWLPVPAPPQVGFRWSYPHLLVAALAIAGKGWHRIYPNNAFECMLIRLLCVLSI